MDPQIVAEPYNCQDHAKQNCVNPFSGHGMQTEPLCETCSAPALPATRRAPPAEGLPVLSPLYFWTALTHTFPLSLGIFSIVTNWTYEGLGMTHNRTMQMAHHVCCTPLSYDGAQNFKRCSGEALQHAAQLLEHIRQRVPMPQVWERS